MNSNLKNIIFVPGCLLCPSYQADSSNKNRLWNQEFFDFFFKNRIELVQMPCPESTFSNKSCGISRLPHGLQFYENLSGFSEHCQYLSTQVVAQIHDFNQHEDRVLAILGVEHSPTCAVNYMYTHLGTVHRSGIFLKYIIEALKQANMDITVIGINRRYPQKAISQLYKLKNN